MRPSFLHIAPLASLALLLSACIFDRGGGTFTHKALISGYVVPLSDGSGIGVEDRNYGDGFLSDDIDFWPYGKNQGPDSLSPAWFDHFPDDPDWAWVVGLSARQTRIFKADKGILLPNLFDTTTFGGTRCTFSNPVGYRFNIHGGGDTMPVLFDKVSFTVVQGDSVCFALRIDTAGTGGDYSDSTYLVGHVDLNCPEP